MRRFIVLLAFLMGLVGTVPNAAAHHKPGACNTHWRTPDAPHYSPWAVRQIIKCAVAHYSVPKSSVGSGLATALYIARHESGFQNDCNGCGPWADNPHSTACGVYQFISGTWNLAWQRFGSRYLFNWCHNARTNILLAVRWAHVYGWGAWATAP